MPAEEEEGEEDESTHILWTDETRGLLAQFIASKFAASYVTDSDDLVECGCDMIRSYFNTLENKEIPWTDENKRLLISFACSPFADACCSDAEELFDTAKVMLEEYLKKAQPAVTAPKPNAVPPTV